MKLLFLVGLIPRFVFLKEKIFKDDELVNMIDPILATDDKNHDGFIDYPEFVMAQQAATARS